MRTCALRNNPPVDPPKIGLGVLGFNFGAVHTAGAAGAASFAASAARITTEVRARDAVRGVVAIALVVAYDAEADMANMFYVRKRVWRTGSDTTREVRYRSRVCGALCGVDDRSRRRASRAMRCDDGRPGRPIDAECPNGSGHTRTLNLFCSVCGTRGFCLSR